MQISSDAFGDGEKLPRKYTCDGQDTSPPLRWGGEPEGTKSFAIICEDPDAPNGVFEHWGLFNIPANKKELSEGLSIENDGQDYVAAENDFGNSEYGGACPPEGHGTHEYHFRVYALSQNQLDVPHNASVDALKEAAQNAAIDQAEIVAKYERR